MSAEYVGGKKGTVATISVIELDPPLDGKAHSFCIVWECKGEEVCGFFSGEDRFTTVKDGLGELQSEANRVGRF